MQSIPLWLKSTWTVFVAVWMAVYLQYYGPQNFLWLCDMANIIVAFALWMESPLLLSSQAVSILLIQILWCIDVLGRTVSGIHIVGGTEYMFNASHPLTVRLFSLFHIATPVVVLWTVRRLGYDGRGWLVQTGIAWIVLPASFFLADAQRNINWVWGLFGRPQTSIDAHAFFVILMIGYPAIVYLPTHLLLKMLFARKSKSS